MIEAMASGYANHGGWCASMKAISEAENPRCSRQSSILETTKKSAASPGFDQPEIVGVGDAEEAERSDKRKIFATSITMRSGLKCGRDEGISRNRLSASRAMELPECTSGWRAATV